MKEKKQSKDWYIAATHWLTAGVLMPFLIRIVLGTPAVIIIGEDNTALLFVVMEVIWIIGIWLGVINAAKYINKTYIIKNSKNITKMATIYLGISQGGYILFQLSKGVTGASIIDIGFFVVGVTVFCILSKKYIKNSEEVMAQ